METEWTEATITAIMALIMRAAFCSLQVFETVELLGKNQNHYFN